MRKELCPTCNSNEHFIIRNDETAKRICKCGSEWFPPADDPKDVEIQRQAALILRLKAENETLKAELRILNQTGN